MAVYTNHSTCSSFEWRTLEQQFVNTTSVFINSESNTPPLSTTPTPGLTLKETLSQNTASRLQPPTTSLRNWPQASSTQEPPQASYRPVAVIAIHTAHLKPVPIVWDIDNSPRRSYQIRPPELESKHCPPGKNPPFPRPM